MPQFYAPVTLPGNPANPLEASPKQYTDTKLYMLPTALKTVSYTAAPGEYVQADLTSGSFNLTMPNAPANGTLVGARIVLFSAGSTVSLLAQGTDVFNRAGASNQVLGALQMGNSSTLYEYANGVWYQVANRFLIGNMNSYWQPLATLTAKGDIYVATASGVAARQGVGTNGQTLMADSTQTNGLAWGSREIGYAAVTANVGNVGASAVRIVGVASVVYVAGHKYEITGTWRSLGGSVNNDIFTFFIGFGAAPASGIAELQVPMINTIIGTQGNTLVGRYAPGSNVTQDTYLYCVRNSGTGLGIVGANSSVGPIQLIIKDTT